MNAMGYMPFHSEANYRGGFRRDKDASNDVRRTRARFNYEVNNRDKSNPLMARISSGSGLGVSKHTHTPKANKIAKMTDMGYMPFTAEANYRGGFRGDKDRSNDVRRTRAKFNYDVNHRSKSNPLMARISSR